MIILDRFSGSEKKNTNLCFATSDVVLYIYYNIFQTTLKQQTKKQSYVQFY